MIITLGAIPRAPEAGGPGGHWPPHFSALPHIYVTAGITAGVSRECFPRETNTIHTQKYTNTHVYTHTLAGFPYLPSVLF